MTATVIPLHPVAAARETVGPDPYREFDPLLYRAGELLGIAADLIDTWGTAVPCQGGACPAAPGPRCVLCSLDTAALVPITGKVTSASALPVARGAVAAAGIAAPTVATMAADLLRSTGRVLFHEALPARIRLVALCS